MSLLDELKRRNVFRVAIAYIVLAWLMAQVAQLLLETFGAPAWVLKSLLALFLIGFPFAIFFAWAFELTPEGLKKEKDVDRSRSITAHTGRKLDYAIIIFLVLALGYFAWDKFENHPAPATPATQTAAAGAKNAPAATALPGDKSVAVLPFENRSDRKDDEYFTEGIHDDLLTHLAQIASLRVISRTSVEQFKGTTLSIHDIAKKLNVATVLEGGVQRAGNKVRINLQLIDAATDTHLWAKTYDRELTTDNIFAIQSEIAGAVTDALRATLSPQEKSRIGTVPTKNMAALEEYFKGRAEMDQRTLPAIESAQMRFEHARTLDPGFALAWAGEAEANILLSDGIGAYGDVPLLQAIQLAQPLSERALQLAPDDPQVLAVNGLLAQYQYDLAAALDYYQRSLAINPSSGEVMNWKILALYATGHFKEALDFNRRMVEVDPMSMISLYNSIINLSETVNPPDPEPLLQRLTELNASFGLSTRGSLAEGEGHIALAARYYYQSLDADPGRSANRNALGGLLLRLGLEKEGLAVAPTMADQAPFWLGRWEEAVQVARQDYAKNPGTPAVIGRLMQALIWTGDKEAAFSLAQKLWGMLGNNPFQLAQDGMISDMAWVAASSEHPVEARQYRDAEASIVQARKDAGLAANYDFLMQAQLAALDRRDDDAVKALSRAIDKGIRWQFGGQAPVFAALKDNPGFQAQVNRMRDLIEQERREILTMLCGPDTILTQWKPAPGTCELYRKLPRA